MRQHTPHVHGDGRPLPYFPDVDEPSAPDSDELSIDVDLSDIRPTPAFPLLEYRRISSVGADMDDAFFEAEALPDEPSRARSLGAKVVFGVVFGGIAALLGYEIMTLATSSWQPLFNEFRRPWH